MEAQILETDPKIEFLNSVNGDPGESEIVDLHEDALLSILDAEVDAKEIHAKLWGSEQEKIKVRTIILDSRLDFVNSAKKLQEVFNTELVSVTNQLNEKYNAEVLKIKQLYRKELVGRGLIELINAVNEYDWVLVMKQNSVNLYKCYNPCYPVSHGYYEDGRIRDYADPVTYLRGIYVNILHPKITLGTIYLQTEGGAHPNCGTKGFGSACPGTLQDREIPITDTNELIALLNEISSTYEKMHLDSAYYVPTQNYTERKESPQWTT